MVFERIVRERHELTDCDNEDKNGTHWSTVNRRFNHELQFYVKTPTQNLRENPHNLADHLCVEVDPKISNYRIRTQKSTTLSNPLTIVLFYKYITLNT